MAKPAGPCGLFSPTSNAHGGENMSVLRERNEAKASLPKLINPQRLGGVMAPDLGQNWSAKALRPL